MKDPKRILLATKFDGSSGAAEAAAALAGATGGSIHVLCVLEALMYGTPEMATWAERDPRTHPEITRKLRETLHALRARGAERVDGGVEYGIARDVILRHANGGRFDLLVLGDQGHRGGVGAYLKAHATIPVMAVPEEGVMVDRAAPIALGLRPRTP